MARRHWLDPLARRLLIATGQLPAPTPSPALAPPLPIVEPADDHQEAVERELLALRLAQNPALRLRDAAEVRRAARLGWGLDVNRASAADWLRLPGCRPEQADLLLRLQAGGVQLSGPEDLQRVLDLDDTTLRAWWPLLRFHWYGQPPLAGPAPVAVNRAEAAELQARLGLSPERCDRLLAERGRAPFRDLAELQQRLQLPAALVEDWIGRVAFEPAGTGGPGAEPGAARRGPALPPTARPGR
jgi:DNA uptake protein ComE-like DNA-binding protein